MPKSLQLSAFVISGFVSRLKDCLEKAYYDHVLLEQITFLFRYSNNELYLKLFIRVEGFKHLLNLLNNQAHSLEGVELTLKAIYAFILMNNETKLIACQHNCIDILENTCRYLINDDIRILTIYILQEIISHAAMTNSSYYSSLLDRMTRMIIRLISITSPFTELTAIRLTITLFQNKQIKQHLITLQYQNYWLNYLNMELFRIVMTLDGDREIVRIEAADLYRQICEFKGLRLFTYTLATMIGIGITTGVKYSDTFHLQTRIHASTTNLLIGSNKNGPAQFKSPLNWSTLSTSSKSAYNYNDPNMLTSYQVQVSSKHIAPPLPETSQLQSSASTNQMVSSSSSKSMSQKRSMSETQYIQDKMEDNIYENNYMKPTLSSKLSRESSLIMMSPSDTVSSKQRNGSIVSDDRDRFQTTGLNTQSNKRLSTCSNTSNTNTPHGADYHDNGNNSSSSSKSNSGLRGLNIVSGKGTNIYIAPSSGNNNVTATTTNSSSNNNEPNSMNNTPRQRSQSMTTSPLMTTNKSMLKSPLFSSQSNENDGNENNNMNNFSSGSSKHIPSKEGTITTMESKNSTQRRMTTTSPLFFNRPTSPTLNDRENMSSKSLPSSRPETPTSSSSKSIDMSIPIVTRSGYRIHKNSDNSTEITYSTKQRIIYEHIYPSASNTTATTTGGTSKNDTSNSSRKLSVISVSSSKGGSRKGSTVSTSSDSRKLTHLVKQYLENDTNHISESTKQKIITEYKEEEKRKGEILETYLPYEFDLTSLFEQHAVPTLTQLGEYVVDACCNICGAMLLDIQQYTQQIKLQATQNPSFNYHTDKAYKDTKKIHLEILQSWREGQVHYSLLFVVMYLMVQQKIDPNSSTLNSGSSSGFGGGLSGFGGGNLSFGSIDLKNKAAGVLQQWLMIDPQANSELYETLLSPNLVNTSGTNMEICQKIYNYIKQLQEFSLTYEDQVIIKNLLDIVVTTRLQLNIRYNECTHFLTSMAQKQRELPKIHREILTWEETFKKKVIELRSDLIQDIEVLENCIPKDINERSVKAQIQRLKTILHDMRIVIWEITRKYVDETNYEVMGHPTPLIYQHKINHLFTTHETTVLVSHEKVVEEFNTQMMTLDSDDPQHHPLLSLFVKKHKKKLPSNKLKSPSTDDIIDESDDDDSDESSTKFFKQKKKSIKRKPSLPQVPIIINTTTTVTSTSADTSTTTNNNNIQSRVTPQLKQRYKLLQQKVPENKVKINQQFINTFEESKITTNNVTEKSTLNSISSIASTMKNTLKPTVENLNTSSNFENLIPISDSTNPATINTATTTDTGSYSMLAFTNLDNSHNNYNYRAIGLNYITNAFITNILQSTTKPDATTNQHTTTGTSMNTTTTTATTNIVSNARLPQDITQRSNQSLTGIKTNLLPNTTTTMSADSFASKANSTTAVTSTIIKNIHEKIEKKKKTIGIGYFIDKQCTKKVIKLSMNKLITYQKNRFNRIISMTKKPILTTKSKEDEGVIGDIIGEECVEDIKGNEGNEHHLRSNRAMSKSNDDDDDDDDESDENEEEDEDEDEDDDSDNDDDDDDDDDEEDDNDNEATSYDNKVTSTTVQPQPPSNMLQKSSSTSYHHSHRHLYTAT